MYENNRTETLSRELFQNPTAEYRGTPFWAWNCKLDRDELTWQIDALQAMGFGGFHMHVRTGMATTYLSEEHMALVKACVEKARANKMLAWLYDEDRWPSGAAGGHVTKDPQYRTRYLLFTARPYGQDEGAASLDSSARASRSGNGRLLACYDVELAPDGTLAGYRAIDPQAEARGRKWYAYLETPLESPWYNNQTYVNTLDRKAIDRFIEVTYEAYLKTCGEDFGGIVPAIFTDEPQFSHKTTLPFAHDTSDVVLPWTDDLPDTFAAAYGDALLPRLPELIWDLPEGAVSLARYRYHDHIAERFADAFADNCGAWCDAHGLMLTGHMMEESTLKSQTAALGEAMRSYRAFGLPGIDMLGNQYEFTTAKQAQSASRQFGRTGVLSELYGVTNWDFDFRGHKLQGDWQAALGVTVRVPHLSWVSMAGEAKRDYPASINYQSPWYQEYKLVEDHFARVNTALTRGKAEVHVAVIHPVESYWLHWGPAEQTALKRDQLDQNFLAITDWLLKGAIDFDFVSESLLPLQCPQGGAPLAVGKMAYDVVVLPAMETIRATTVERLEAFVRAGGKLVVLGAAPRLVDAQQSDAGRKLAAKASCLPFERYALLHCLEDVRVVSLRNANGSLAENFVTQLRADGDSKWLFMAQGVPDLNRDIARRQDVRIIVRGLWQPTVYDTMTGDVRPVPCRQAGGSTVVEWDFHNQDSLLLRLEPGTAESTSAAAALTMETPILLPRALAYTLSEPNVLLLDVAEYRLDDKPFHPREEVLRADNVIRGWLGWPERGNAVAQPWVVPEETATHTATLRFRVESELALTGTLLALEDAGQAVITLNGQTVPSVVTGYFTDKAIGTVALPELPAGLSVLDVTWPFHRRSNLEWCYLLGDFGVQLAGQEATLTAKPATLGFGDCAPQGLPFYGANITYHVPFHCEGGDVRVHAPNYRGALVRVALDGGPSAPVAFAPYDHVFQGVPAGEHRLDITLFGNRHNSFGALHNADLNVSWIGPDCWRSTGDRWCYEYRLHPMGVLTAPTVTLLHP